MDGGLRSNPITTLNPVTIEHIMNTPTQFIASQGCELLSSSVGNHKDLLLSTDESAAMLSTFARNPYFSTSVGSIISLVGTVALTSVMPLVKPTSALAPTSTWDPIPFPGVIIQITGSDLQRVIGNSFTLSWVFASHRFGSMPVQTQTATFQLNKPTDEGTFIGIIPATVVSGKSRLSLPHLWRPTAPDTAQDTMTIAGLAVGMTAQLRLLTHHDGAFKLLCPQLHEALQRAGQVS